MIITGRNLENEDYYLRNFEKLLYDSVYLLYYAFDIKPDKHRDNIVSTFVRSSMLNSALLLECGANCLIDSLDLPKKIYIEIEKFSIVSKFEYYLYHRLNQKLDRGCREIQEIAELKKLRDVYVHLKVEKTSPRKIKENSWETDFGQTEILKIPRNIQSWKKTHAVLALKAVNNFYNKFLLEWCQFNTDLIVDLLIGSGKPDSNNPSGAYVDCVGGLDRAVNEWGVDFKYLGKIIPNNV